MRIKRQALKWAMAGEYFTVHDLKEHLALDCSEATITNALKEPGAVRRAARGGGRAVGLSRVVVFARCFRGTESQRTNTLGPSMRLGGTAQATYPQREITFPSGRVALL